MLALDFWLFFRLYSWFPMYCCLCSLKYFCFELIRALILAVIKNNPIRDCIMSSFQGFLTESHDFQLNWKEVWPSYFGIIPRSHSFWTGELRFLWSDTVAQRNATSSPLTNWGSRRTPYPLGRLEGHDFLRIQTSNSQVHFYFHIPLFKF